MLDIVLGRIRRRARIAVCGRISEYLVDPKDYHRHRNIYRLGLQDAKMEAFFIFDYFNNYENTSADLIRRGDFNALEDILQGIETMPQALIGLYEGASCGIFMVMACDNNTPSQRRDNKAFRLNPVCTFRLANYGLPMQFP